MKKYLHFSNNYIYWIQDGTVYFKNNNGLILVSAYTVEVFENVIKNKERFGEIKEPTSSPPLEMTFDPESYSDGVILRNQEKIYKLLQEINNKLK